jgi:prenyltransferase beta subunit
METNDFTLPSNPLAWLLEKENPSVRYFTLRDLLKKDETEPEVIEARHSIMTSGIVPAILARQEGGGYWGQPEQFYTDKYKGTIWQMLILAELAADGNDPRIKKMLEFILTNSQERNEGGFSYRRSEKLGGGLASGVVPCLTGNMVFSLVRLGYLEDEKTQKAINWICRYQRADDGIDKAPEGEPYDRYEMCWGKHSCHMGVVKSLKALAEIPEEKRSEELKSKIEELAEYLLAHRIHKKSHDQDKVSRPGWLRLGFPLMYQTDILEILGILRSLGYRDPRMDEALEMLKSKQTKNGRWKLENSFNGRMIKNIETKGTESKWVTLKSLNILKEYN